MYIIYLYKVLVTSVRFVKTSIINIKNNIFCLAGIRFIVFDEQRSLAECKKVKKKILCYYILMYFE